MPIAQGEYGSAREDRPLLDAMAGQHVGTMALSFPAVISFRFWTAFSAWAGTSLESPRDACNSIAPMWLRALAVHLQPDPDHADAPFDDRPEHPGPPVSEARAEHDLEVNIKAEAEIETILVHLERQNEILMAMLAKQGIKLDEVLKASQS